MKKFIAILLSLICLTGSLSFFSAAEEKPFHYLLLGDSLTEGFGVRNPDEASYGKIVADTNGYCYHNHSKMSRDSGELLALIKTDTKMREDIKIADLISLSIGSNDYLSNDEVVFLVIGALAKVNDKKMDAIAENYYQNLCAIMNIIQQLNPDVTVLLQGAYVVWNGFAEVAFRAGASRVNQQMKRYIENHPGRATYCDISPAMQGHPERLADDCVHPNAQGNIEIARLVLAQLKDMGLGTELEPVVLVPGINYNYFTDYISKFFGPLITVIVKLLTGNAVNIFR